VFDQHQDILLDNNPDRVHFHMQIIKHNKKPCCCWDSRSYCIGNFGSGEFDGSGST